MTKQDRKEFEAWARSKNYNTSIFDDGTYVFADIQVMSDAWLAARRTQSEQVRALVEAAQDMLSGWRYIRQMHGDLHGVGWDRAQSKVESALAQLKEQDDE